MGSANRIRVVVGVGVIALAAIGVAATVGAGEEAENPRPREARVSGNTWCGPVSRLGNDPIYAIYGELARYVDAGAKVVGHSETEGVDSETFVLCGLVRGRQRD